MVFLSTSGIDHEKEPAGLVLLYVNVAERSEAPPNIQTKTVLYIRSKAVLRNRLIVTGLVLLLFIYYPLYS